jgi:AraC-like DNA-binding protein
MQQQCTLGAAPHGTPAKPARRAAVQSEPLALAAIVAHVRANVAQRIAVHELADVAHLSVFQLTRALRREHRTTPYALVLDVRVRHAASLLASGAPIVEAALRAGFADQSHLTRHFKRRLGMTPKKYCDRRRLDRAPSRPVPPRMPRAGADAPAGLCV